jgi:hypothetical protein
MGTSYFIFRKSALAFQKAAKSSSKTQQKLAKSSIICLSVFLFQEGFVDILNRFPIQIQMLGNLADRQFSAEVPDVIGKPFCNSLSWFDKFQFFHTCAATARTTQTAVSHVEKNLCLSKVQISHRSMVPFMNFAFVAIAFMTKGFIAEIWDDINLRKFRFFIYRLGVPPKN